MISLEATDPPSPSLRRGSAKQRLSVTNQLIPGRIRARLLAIHVFPGPAERVISRKRGGDAQLVVVTGGRYQAHRDIDGTRETVLAGPGDVVFWPSHTERSEESIPGKPLCCISIYLYWPEAPRDLPPRVRDFHYVIHFLAHRLLALSHDPVRKTLMERLGSTYLNAILAEYISLAASSEGDLESIVMNYAEAHMCRRIRLSDLANHVGLTVTHFSRSYKKQTGRSPIRDVQQRKAAHAKMILLQHPRRGLRDVAARVGVRDATTLGRLLKRYTGVTARDIRKLAGKR